MGGRMAVVLGAIVSGILGYMVFRATGLCDACSSTFTSFVAGIIIVGVYLWSFRVGMRGAKPAIEAESEDTPD